MSEEEKVEVKVRLTEAQVKVKLKELSDALTTVEDLVEKTKKVKTESDEKIGQMKKDGKLSELEASIKTLKDEIGEEAIANFKATNDKKFLGGVGVEEKTSYEYSAEDALDWAKKHELCLQLDSKAFKAMLKTQKFDFVKKINFEKATFPAKIKLED